jgi:hypothetical protein
MTPPKSASDPIHLPKPEFEALLEATAEDVRDLRSLLEAIKIVRHTLLQTIVHVVVTAAFVLLVLGATIKLKLFGSGS